MKKLKVLLSVIAMSFVMIGCGGGGGGDSVNLPSVDNSILADGENEWGYYGTNVLFGEYLVAQSWTAIDESDDTFIDIEFFSDGDFLFDGYYVGVYGVSLDGRTIRSDILNDITITGVRENYYGVYNNGILQYTLDCYDANVGGQIVVMCPVSF